MSKKKKSQLKVTSLSGKECTVTLGKDGFLDLSALPKAPVEWLRSPERRGNFEAGITRVEIVLCQLRDEKRMTVVYWPSLTFNPDEGKHVFLDGRQLYHVSCQRRGGTGLLDSGGCCHQAGTA